MDILNYYSILDTRTGLSMFDTKVIIVRGVGHSLTIKKRYSTWLW